MNILNKILFESLERNEAIVEVTIIEHHGSTPRTAGAKMLVRSDKSIAGTIGGGLYEAQAINLAHSMYSMNKDKTEDIAFLTYFSLKGSEKPTDMDMVCGGDLRLLVNYIPPTKENLTIYKSLYEAEYNGIPSLYIAKIEAKEAELQTLENANLNNVAHGEKIELKLAKSLLYSNKSKYKDIGIENISAEVQSHIDFNNSFKTIKNLALGSCEYIFEKFEKKFTLHFFGAGHVSCELAKITSYLGFRTIVLDDREEFANQERFPNATTIVLSSLEESAVKQYLDEAVIDSQDGIVILTRGHARDRDALAAALTKNPGYLGMIGSKTKRKSTYDFLLENGYKAEDFEKIHSPIGISIGAQTPEEIAISISAELIQWRAGVL